MEMSGRALAKLTRLLCQCNGQGSELELAMGLKYKPPRNRAVVPLHWVQREVTGRSGPIDRTLAFSVRSRDTCHVSPLFEYYPPDLNGQ